jgi:predicted RNA binding protein YcfA (HicA-like mRNA interferase family)
LKSPSDAEVATPHSPRDCRRIGEIGFSLTRQSGSHQIYRNAAGKRATVPLHASKILHPKVLKSILRDAELSPEELEKLL